MAQKPETKYLNRIRKIFKNLEPSIQIYKHADKFNSGIADLHYARKGGEVGWIEGKWIPSITKKRKVGVTDLQVEYLKEHSELGVPAYVLIGSPKGSVFIEIQQYTGEVTVDVFEKDILAVENFLNQHRGVLSNYTLEPGREINE